MVVRRWVNTWYRQNTIAESTATSFSGKWAKVFSTWAKKQTHERKTGELLDLGAKAGIIEKSGSWFSYNDERIGQGRENAKNFLRENPNIAREIENKIRTNAGLLATAMTAAPEEGEDEDDE